MQDKNEVETKAVTPPAGAKPAAPEKRGETEAEFAKRIRGLTRASDEAEVVLVPVIGPAGKVQANGVAMETDKPTKLTREQIRRVAGFVALNSKRYKLVELPESWRKWGK